MPHPTPPSRGATAHRACQVAAGLFTLALSSACISDLPSGGAGLDPADRGVPTQDAAPGAEDSAVPLDGAHRPDGGEPTDTGPLPSDAAVPLDGRPPEDTGPAPDGEPPPEDGEPPPGDADLHPEPLDRSYVVYGACAQSFDAQEGLLTEAQRAHGYTAELVERPAHAQLDHFGRDGGFTVSRWLAPTTFIYRIIDPQSGRSSEPAQVSLIPPEGAIFINDSRDEIYDDTCSLPAAFELIRSGQPSQNSGACTWSGPTAHLVFTSESFTYRRSYPLGQLAEDQARFSVPAGAEVTLHGCGTDKTQLSGSLLGRMFMVDKTATLRLHDLHVHSNSAYGMGAALRLEGRAELYGVLLSQNQIIGHNGTASHYQVVLPGHPSYEIAGAAGGGAGALGGAIYVSPTAQLTLDRSQRLADQPSALRENRAMGGVGGSISAQPPGSHDPVPPGGQGGGLYGGRGVSGSSMPEPDGQLNGGGGGGSIGPGFIPFAGGDGGPLGGGGGGALFSGNPLLSFVEPPGEGHGGGGRGGLGSQSTATVTPGDMPGACIATSPGPGGGGAGLGGALFIDRGGQVALGDVRFENNEATGGEAGALHRTTPPESFCALPEAGRGIGPHILNYGDSAQVALLPSSSNDLRGVLLSCADLDQCR